MPEVGDLLRYARSQSGVREGAMGSNRTKYAAMAGDMNGAAWCATFVAAAAAKGGLRLPEGAETASCYLNEIAFKRAGRLYTKPQVGDVFFVFFPPLMRSAHTGF